MALNDVFRLTMLFTSGVQSPFTVVNTWTFKQNSSVLILDTPEEDLLGAWRAEVEGNYAYLYTSTIRLSTYKVGQSPVFATSLLEDVSPVVPGNVGGEALPPITAGLISIRTATLTRRGRGRSFLPPSGESSSGGSGPNSGYLDSMDAVINGIMGLDAETVNHAAWQVGVWSTKDQVFRPATSLLARLRWASQKDRERVY